MTLSKTATLPPIDTTEYTRTETATFALGCFWGIDALFGSTPGVIRSRSGFAGDHTEAVQIAFDPDQIAYEQLLDIVWNNHDPAKRETNPEYLPVVFSHDATQQKLALESKGRVAAKLGREVFTQVAPFSGFHLAAAYHQKYALQQTPALMKELQAIYPDFADFIASTAVARVNGYLNGYGQVATLQAEIDRYGLSAAGKRQLLDTVARYNR